MDTSITAIISKALDGLSLRSVATAQNVANANSLNYRPLRVSFEEELAAAAAKGEGAVKSVLLGFDELDPAASGGLRIDLELATQSETARRYGALVDVLNRGLQLQRTVIRGGQ